MYRYRNGMETGEDVRFLRENGVSETAVRVAVRMGRDSHAEKERILERILRELS